MANTARPHLNVRLPPKLMKALREAAAHENSTLNGSINQRLEQSFHREDMADLIEATAAATATALQQQLNDIDRIVRKRDRRHAAPR